MNKNNATPVVHAPPLPNKTVQRVLSVVNPIRQALGMGPLDDLPLGHPGEPANCPFANSLETEDAFLPDVYGNEINFDDPAKADAARKALAREGITAVTDDTTTLTVEGEHGEAMDKFVEKFDDARPHYGRYQDPNDLNPEEVPVA